MNPPIVLALCLALGLLLFSKARADSSVTFHEINIPALRSALAQCEGWGGGPGGPLQLSQTVWEHVAQMDRRTVKAPYALAGYPFFEEINHLIEMNYLRWRIEQARKLSREGIPSAYLIAKIHIAGLTAVTCGRDLPRHRDFASRVSNLYIEEALHGR